MRLIDADFAEDLLLAHEQNAKAMGKTEYAKGIRTAYADVSVLCRTIKDAVPVVRFRDCKNREGSVCDYSSVYIEPNGFCHWGERKDDA